MVLTRQGRKSMSSHEFTELKNIRELRKSSTRRYSDSIAFSGSNETSPNKKPNSRAGPQETTVLSPKGKRKQKPATESTSLDDDSHIPLDSPLNDSEGREDDILGYVIDKSPKAVSGEHSKSESVSSDPEIENDRNTRESDESESENESEECPVKSTEKADTVDETEENPPYFVIDKTPRAIHVPAEDQQESDDEEDDKEKDDSDDEDDDDESDDDDDDDDDEDKNAPGLLKQNQKHGKNKDMYALSSSLQVDLDPEDTYINMNLFTKHEKTKPEKSVKKHKALSSAMDQSEIMKKSVITPDFEKKHSVPTYEESLNQLKKQRRKEREKFKGKGWFDMPATELTEERKNDLLVLQYRRSLDPKHFYKAPDIRALPKYYQMGTVVETAADFYHSRIPKKQRKTTLVDELLADVEFRKYNKRKYAEIQETQKRSRGAHKHMKRLKKKK